MKAKQLGKTIFKTVLSKKVRQVLAIADRVYILKLGQVSDSGEAKEMLAGERLRKAFL